jgi:hypothetical protein
MTLDHSRWPVPVVLAAFGVDPLAAQQALDPGERISFVACPIVRDTRSVPCWLSEYDGQLYYLTIQSDVSAEVQPPMLGHRVLVEGTIADAAPICGGIVLEPVRLSVMPERAADCNAILPADARYTVDFNPRPPGPSAGRLAFAPDPSEPRVPVVEREFDLYFDFDRGVSFRHPAVLTAILQSAARMPPMRVKVTGMRASHRLSDGTLLQESVGVGERRADEVARLLRGAGIAAPINVDWREADADGIDDWQGRRVTVTLEP